MLRIIIVIGLLSLPIFCVSQSFSKESYKVGYEDEFYSGIWNVKTGESYEITHIDTGVMISVADSSGALLNIKKDDKTEFVVVWVVKSSGEKGSEIYLSLPIFVTGEQKIVFMCPRGLFAEFNHYTETSK